MKTNYFTLNEAGDAHIGVVSANNNKELKEKIVLALSEHFDIFEIKSVGKLNIKSIGTHPVSFKVVLDQFKTEIEIQQTWIY